MIKPMSIVHESHIYYHILILQLTRLKDLHILCKMQFLAIIKYMYLCQSHKTKLTNVLHIFSKYIRFVRYIYASPAPERCCSKTLLASELCHFLRRIFHNLLILTPFKLSYANLTAIIMFYAPDYL